MQIKYFINLIKVFCIFTQINDKRNQFTIHEIFQIYDKLFDHLNNAKLKLTRKKTTWKKIVLKKLNKTYNKFCLYYVNTQNFLNFWYDRTTFLNFNRKNFIFREFNWQKKRKEFMNEKILKKISQCIWSTLCCYVFSRIWISKTNQQKRWFWRRAECEFWHVRHWNKWNKSLS